MAQLAIDAIDLPRNSSTAIVCLTIAVLTAAFFSIEHRNFERSTLEAFTVTGDDMESEATQGDIGRRIGIPMIAVFGALMLLRSEGKRLALQGDLGWLVAGYFIWCGLTILWSADRPLTLRHFGVTALCGMGALGIVRQLKITELCTVTLAVTSILVLGNVLLEVGLGTFRPWDAEYRFSGTLHPNSQATYCAAMAMSAFCLADHNNRGKAFYTLLCLAGILLMVLTKLRTVCATFLAGALIYKSCDTSWFKLIRVGSAAIAVILLLALVVSLLGWDIEKQVVNIALIGREGETDSLSGRVPLWTALMPYIQERVLLGHGYMTFWSPERVGEFSKWHSWTVSDGHCAYIDIILDLGVIGAALCIPAILLCINEIFRRFRITKNIGYGFLLAFLAYRLLNGVMESGFIVPTSFPSFVLMCSLAHLAFCKQEDTEQVPTKEKKE